MNEMQNAMTVTAQRAQEATESARMAIVDAYDPTTFSVKVILQPTGAPSGWIPVASCFVGNGWGMLAAPSIGDMVRVDFQEGELNAGAIGASFFNDVDRPPLVQSGEFLLKHGSGSLLKFNNDGSVDLIAVGDINSSAPAWNHTGPMNIAGLVTVDGAIRATGEITDFYTTQSYSMRSFRLLYNIHTHPENNTGSTNVPNQQA